MKRELESARNIIRFLVDKGYEAYLVGGFVRDHLLGLPTADIDITTNAKPEKVMEIFPGTRATGLRFGTVTVMSGKQKFEVTTFRTEGEYLNHRHPGKVTFSDSLEQDLERRDFTINAMAMDIEGKIIDCFSGKEDLDRRMIRAIGDPVERFHEDALRILRAFRFVAKLDFDIEADTFKAINANRNLLGEIANERIMQEIKKIIAYPYAAKAFCLMESAGVHRVLPGLENGIAHLCGKATVPSESTVFYGLCFVLNNGIIPDNWRFSTKDRQRLRKIVALTNATRDKGIDAISLYEHGLKICLDANKIQQLLGWRKDEAQAIRQTDRNLPIHSEADLEFKGKDIVNLVRLNDKRLIGELIDIIVNKIIRKELENDHARIREFVIDYTRNMKKDTRT